MLEKNKLLRFHLDNAGELVSLTDEFNILLYGYGNKKQILEQIFPTSILINCFQQDLETVVEEITDKIATIHSLKRPKAKFWKTRLLKIDSQLIEQSVSVTLIFLNFTKKFLEFFEYKNIRLIGTLDNIHIDIGQEDIDQYQIVFRDMTTFIPYDEETQFIETDVVDNIQKVTTILEVLSKKVKNTFKFLLRALQNSSELNFDDLVQNVGRRILMKDPKAILSLLCEFFDHEILKVTNENKITIILNSQEITRVLQLMEQNNE